MRWLKQLFCKHYWILVEHPDMMDLVVCLKCCKFNKDKVIMNTRIAEIWTGKKGEKE